MRYATDVKHDLDLVVTCELIKVFWVSIQGTQGKIIHTSHEQPPSHVPVSASKYLEFAVTGSLLTGNRMQLCGSISTDSAIMQRITRTFKI